ncbi:unnamed protein product [Prunus brigantina]
MSSEYAIDGFYSIKSDVYSFGGLVVEIVSGKRNIYYLFIAFFFPSFKSIEVLDTSIGDLGDPHEVVRLFHACRSFMCAARGGGHGTHGMKAGIWSWLMKYWQIHIHLQNLMDFYF